MLIVVLALFLLPICALIAIVWSKAAAVCVFSIGLFVIVLFVFLLKVQIWLISLSEASGRFQEKQREAARAKSAQTLMGVQCPLPPAAPSIHPPVGVDVTPPSPKPNTDVSPGWQEYGAFIGGVFFGCCDCDTAAGAGDLSCRYCEKPFSLPVPQVLTPNNPGWGTQTGNTEDQTVRCLGCGNPTEYGDDACANCGFRFYLPVGSRVVSSDPRLSLSPSPALEEPIKYMSGQEMADDLFGIDPAENNVPVAYSPGVSHIVPIESTNADEAEWAWLDELPLLEDDEESIPIKGTERKGTER